MTGVESPALPQSVHIGGAGGWTAGQQGALVQVADNLGPARSRLGEASDGGVVDAVEHVVAHVDGDVLRHTVDERPRSRERSSTGMLAWWRAQVASTWRRLWTVHAHSRPAPGQSTALAAGSQMLRPYLERQPQLPRGAGNIVVRRRRPLGRSVLKGRPCGWIKSRPARSRSKGEPDPGLLRWRHGADW